MAGLGGSAAGSVILDTAGLVRAPVDSAGGWTQLKIRPVMKIEANAAFGEDYSFARNMAVPVRRNASGFLNIIYQPRSNLVFSVEYRRLWTSRFQDPTVRTGHVNLGAGVLF